MAVNEDALERIHKELSKKYSNLGDLNNFTETLMNSEEARRSVHQAMSELYDMGDYDNFVQQMGLVSTETPQEQMGGVDAATGVRNDSTALVGGYQPQQAQATTEQPQKPQKKTTYVETSSKNNPGWYEQAMMETPIGYGMTQNDLLDQTLVPLSREESRRTAKERREISANIRTEQEIQRAAATKNVVDAMKRTYDYKTQMAQQGNEVSMEKAREEREAEVNAQRMREAAANYAYDYVVKPAVDNALGDSKFNKEILKVQDAKESAKLLNDAMTDEAAAIYARTAYGADFSRMSQDQRNGIKNELEGQMAGKMVEELSSLKAPTSAIEYYQRKVRESMMMNQVQGFITNVLGTDYAQMSRAVEQNALTNYENSTKEKWYGGVLTGAAQGTSMFLDMMLMDKFLKSGPVSWMNNVAGGSLSGYSASWAPGSRGVAQAVVDKLVNNAWTNGIIRGSAAMASQYMTFGRIDAVNAGLGILNDPDLIKRYGNLNTVGGWLNELGSDASNIVNAYAHGGETGAKLFTIGHLTAGIPGIAGKALGFGAEVGFFTVNGVKEKIDEHNRMNPNDQIGLWDYDNWTQDALTNVGMVGAMKLMGTTQTIAGADLRTRSQRMTDYANSTNDLMKKIGMEFDRDDFYALERAGLGKMKAFDFNMMQKLMESGNYERLLKSNELPLTTLFKLRMAMEHRMGVAGYTADDQGNVVATMNPYDLVKQAVWSSGEHGRFNVTAYGMNDEVVMQKSFSTPDEAKKYAAAMNAKGADNGRRMMEMLVGDNMHIVKDAIHEWADENGVGRLDAEEVYSDWLAERENAMPLAKEVSEQIRNKIWAKMSENRQAIIAEIREDIRQKTGVDLNGVLQKPANMLTQEEREAFDQYTKALEERKKDDTTDPAVRIVEKTMDPKSGTVKYGTDGTGREVTVKEGESDAVILTDPNTGETLGMVDKNEVVITNEVPAEQVVETNKAVMAEAERQNAPVEEKPAETAEEELPNGALAEEGTPIKYYDENNDLVEGTYIGPDHMQNWKHVIKDKNGKVVSRRLDEDEIVLPEAKVENSAANTAAPVAEASAEPINETGTDATGMKVDANGMPTMENDPKSVAETYTNGTAGMAYDEAKQVVDWMINDRLSQYQKLQKKQPEFKGNMIKYQQEKAAWQQQIDQIKTEGEWWRGVQNEMQRLNMEKEQQKRIESQQQAAAAEAERQAAIEAQREADRQATMERERAHREFMEALEEKKRKQEELEAQQAAEEMTGDQLAEQAVLEEQSRRNRMRIGQRLAEVGQLTDLTQPADEAMAAQVAYLSPDFKVTPESLRLELGSNFGKFGREGMLRLADNNGRTISEIADSIVQAAGYDANGQWRLDANKVREELVKCIQEGSAEAIEALEKRVGIGTQRPEYWTPEKIAEYEARQQQQQPMTEVQQQIATASEEVNTAPTEAQKEAGNYKKGHVKLDGMEISIEQPKGSTRSGIDAEGMPWSVKMNNTYGYIRGTVGKDKDHIDIFLSDNPEEGNVFVVDQIDPLTGEFDEHKVMYGFNSLEEAREAYLSNYMSDWQGLGNITEVNKTAFKVWLSESVRKTKPFADYRLVKAEQAKMGLERGYDESRDPFAADHTNEFLNGNEGLETLDEAPFRSILKPMSIPADMPEHMVKAGNDAVEMGKRLHTKVNICWDMSQIPENARAYKALQEGKQVGGWYSAKDGEVYLYMPHLESPEEVMKTLLHETVAHRGMREMFGEDFETMLDNVYKYASEDLKKSIDTYWKEMGFTSQRQAVDEYIAKIAEEGPQSYQDKTLLSKVKGFIINALRKMGFDMGNYRLTDDDIRYMLAKSHDYMQYEKTDMTSEYKPKTVIEEIGERNVFIEDPQASRFSRVIPSIEDAINTIRQMFTNSFVNKDGTNRRNVVAGVNERLKSDLQNQGIAVDDSWVHAIDEDRIAHTMNQHGNATTEANRGQIAITGKDFEKIPEILESYDRVYPSDHKNKQGRDVIIYEKRYDDGTIIYLEEVRTGRKSLALDTMYKKMEGSLDGRSADSSSPSTSETTSSSSLPISGRKVTENSLIDQENREISDLDTPFSIRKKEEPKKKGIGYKVFYRNPKDGKLYPPMVANPKGADTPVGVWLDADAAPIVGQTKTGRNQVKAGGKGTQGGSGQLAYRPGWHLGEIPYALQFGRLNPENGKKDLFPKDFVWAEVEYAADKDYQDEAYQAGINANGKYQHSLAGLPHLPEDGFYRYRTNPNPETDPWIITGAMKVNRVLSNDEVDDLVRKAGREPQKREPEGGVKMVRDENTIADNERALRNAKRPTERFDEDNVELTDKNYVEAIYDMGTYYRNYINNALDSQKDSIQYNKDGVKVNENRNRVFGQFETTHIGQNDIVGYRGVSGNGKPIDPVYGRDFYKEQWKNLEEPMQEYKEFFERMAEKATQPWMKQDLLSKARGVENRMYVMKQLAEGVEPTSLQFGRWAASDYGRNEGEVRYRDYEGDDQTRTDNFKRWFGDWENDPENASKVVDAEGKPMVVYHGTQLMSMYFKDGRPYVDYTERFNTFKDGKGFFTSDRDAAESFARGKQGFYEVYLDMKKPFVIDCNGKDWDAIEGYENPDGYTRVTTDYIVNDIKRNHPEYDGVIFKNVMNENSGVVEYPIDNYVPFKAEQIKSAVDNNGDFSRENSDIRYNRTYHGSAADFEEFDHKFMGSGEGSQVYGFGTYVSEVEGIAKSYADIATNKKQKSQDPIVYWKGHEIDFSDANPLRMAFDLVEDSRTIAEARQRAERYADMAEEPEMKQKWQGALDILKQSTKADFKRASVKGNRKLYEVEIPDDNGKNYLSWNDAVSADMLVRIKDEAAKEGYEAVADMVDYYTRNGEISGGDLYNKIIANGLFVHERVKQADAHKVASKLLNNAGIVGVKVPTNNMRGDGDKSKNNYVIFDEKNARIVDKAAFRLGIRDEELEKEDVEKVKPFYDLIDEMFDNPKFDRESHNREKYDLGYTPSFMKEIGIVGDRFSLSFKNIKIHQGKDSGHDLTKEEWKKLPSALKEPFLISRYKDSNDRFRLYVNIKHDGNYVNVGIDVKKVNQGKDRPMLEVNSIKTVFGHKGAISEQENIVAYDNRITPEQEALLRGLNYREYPTIQELAEKAKLFGSKDTDNQRNRQINRAEITETAEKMAENLNKKVKICQNADEISDPSVREAVKKAEAEGRTPTRKGWFNTRTGEIEVYAPAAENVEDVQKTVLHETVGHYGLRELLSKNEHDYNNAMVEMYRLLNNEQKKEVQDMMAKRKYNVATAMDEYLAKMAEDRGNMVEPTFWQKAKSVVKNLLRKIGIDVELTDGDLKYLLWSSHEALKNSHEVVNADGSKSRVYDRKTIDQKAADWAMRWHNDVLGLRSKWEAERGTKRSDVRDRDTDPDDDPTTPGGWGSPSPTGGREYTIEQELNMEAMKFDKQLEEIQNETDKKAVGDRLLRFVKERMQPLTGKRMTSMDINGLISKIEHAKNLTRKSAMENALLDIDDTIVHAEVSAEVEDMLNKLNIKTQTSTNKGLVKGVLVDDTANRILTDIKASYQQMINTTADARMSEIRREIRKKMAEYGISRQDDPAMPEELKNAIAPLKQQLAELAEQKKEMQTNQQMETLEQLNEREQFIQAEIGNIAANGGEMSEAYTEELMALPIKKDLAELRKLKSLIDGVPEGGGDNLNRALEKTSRNSDMWTVLMKEKVRNQRHIASLSRRINEELSNIVGEGRERRRAEVQEEIRRQIELDRITCNALRMNEVTDQQKQKANETFWTSIKDDLQKMNDLNNAPTFSFNFMLKLVDMNHGLGDGELYEHFMKSERGALKANNNMKMGIREFGKNVDDMAEKIFGKGNRASALESLIADSDKRTGKPIYKLTEKSPDPNAVQQRDDRNMTKGEMLYMWLTWRQEAGKLKMMQAGWTERSISEMEEQMGEEYKQFGTWASDVFLPRLRADKYNQTYRKIYGTDMHAAKHYFPIRIDKTAIMDKSEVGMNEPEGMPVSGASNLIVRTGNTLPVDASVNAIEMLLDYGRKMERWNAMQDLVKDLNTIYRCKAVGNLMEANHKGMYEIFKNAANVATGNFDIDENNVYDKIFGYLQRGGTGAAIRYGWYTALKQTLSAPAFLSYDDSWRYQAIRLMNQTPLSAYKNYQWAKENLPAFADRIADNDMGIEGLTEKTVLDILTGKVAKYGMMANKVVDACTVANGAYAIYKYDSERYKKMLNDDGTRKYTDEQAEDRAKVNAELAFNESQQSSRNEFSSPVQKSRSIVNKGGTAFQNSNIGYRRMAIEGYHDWTRAKRIRDNRIAQAEKIADETARAKAIEEAKAYYKKMRKRGAMKMATVGILNAWWFMGLNPALTYRMVTMNGDDDDKDKFVKGMLMNVALGYLTNGTMLGPIISTGVTKIMNGEVRNIDLNPFMFLTVMNDAVNDVKNTLKNDDWGELSWALVKNSIRAGGGVDLEKFDNMWDGIYDIWERGGVKRDDIFKILNMPKSQRKEFAQHDTDLPISEYIKNYMSADKRVNPGERGKAWLGGIGYEKELTNKKLSEIVKTYMQHNQTEWTPYEEVSKKAQELFDQMKEDPENKRRYAANHKTDVITKGSTFGKELWQKAMDEALKDNPELHDVLNRFMNSKAGSTNSGGGIAPKNQQNETYQQRYDRLKEEVNAAAVKYANGEITATTLEDHMQELEFFIERLMKDVVKK